MIPRSVNLSKLLGNVGSGLLLGPRGAGKTLLAQGWLTNQPQCLSYNLLDPEDYRKLLSNPEQLIIECESAISQSKRHTVSVLIDEVQKLPELLDVCHLLIEKHKGKIRFLLTGSSARKLKSRGANLLAGRAYNIRLHPLTITELSDSFNLLSALNFGTLPGIIFSENPSLALRAYVDNYLKEEIQQEAIVRKLDKFFRFLDLAAQLNGEPVNFKKCARQIQVSDKTISDYFQILIDTLLVVQLPGWDRSQKKQILKSPKFYFFDCGVLNAAAKELNVSLEKGSSRFGRLFEQFIITEFKRVVDYNLLDYSLYYYSTGHSEVDLVLARGRHEPPIGIEIKSSDIIHREDLAGLELFSSEYPDASLYCIATVNKSFDITLRNGRSVLVLPYRQSIEKVFG